MVNILLTGSSGTIGTRMFEILLNHEYDVLGIDINENRWNSTLNSKTQIWDLNKPLSLKTAFDPRIVVHLAANARVYNSVVKPTLAFENIQTTYNILEFARRNDIEYFIFASSREVYGDQKGKISEEKVKLEMCESPYTASKICGEALVHAYSKCYGIKSIIVRFSNVYGMYDTSDRFIPKVLKLASNNKPITIYGKDKCLDFTYIDDACSGLMLCVEHINSVNKQVFNIASGKPSLLVDVAQKIKEITGSRSEIIIKENRVGEIENFTADISKARNILNYEPKTSLEEGIKKAYSWYKTMSLI